jgi:hypothetical protein
MMERVGDGWGKNRRILFDRPKKKKKKKKKKRDHHLTSSHFSIYFALLSQVRVRFLRIFLSSSKSMYATFFRARNQVSHPHKLTHNAIIYILILRFGVCSPE